jgi:FKBP-type peptidyl-prolyl cis-trans isomerase 2
MTPLIFKKVDMMKKLLILIALGLFIFGCVGPEPEQPTVEYGDIISVNYILKIDGDIVDTNMVDVARANDIYSPFREYQPMYFQVILGDENPLLPEFVKQTVGMKVNESKVFLVAPIDGYGVYDPTRVYNVSRYYKMDSKETVPMSFFEERGINITEGDGFETEQGTVFIENITGDQVTIMYLYQPGDGFYVNGFHHVVKESINFTYTVMFDVREGASYDTISLIDGKPVTARVTKLTNDTMTFDENHVLAGKTLEYNVTVLSIEKPTG